MSIGLPQRAIAAFAERLNQALDELSINARQRNAWLRDATGVSQASADAWLRGTSMPAEPRRARLAQRLGVRRAWLYEGDGAMHDRGPGVREANVVYLPDAAATPSARETALAWQLAVDRINTYIAAGVLRTAQIDAIDKLARALADIAIGAHKDGPR